MTKQTTQQYSWAKNCHTGNTKIYTEPNGGTLFIGGWNQGATFDWNTHVIDLTGNEQKFWDIPIAYDEDSKGFLPFLQTSCAGWLSLPFPDYGTPKGLTSYAQWLGIAEQIQVILRKGRDVLVACHGGHGRSGLFMAIVGYILNDGKSGWNSPVEHVRAIHCPEAVETLNQEKFVYDILGLDIAITHVYVTATAGATTWGTVTGTKKYQPCPICKTSSMYVGDFGMCLGCQGKYSKNVPERQDLTLDDINMKNEWVDHTCEAGDKCCGIWEANLCGHVTHDMIIYEGYCETCARKREDEQEFAEKKLGAEWIDGDEEECAMCGKATAFSNTHGVCYECGTDAEKDGLLDYVHNSITDPYRAISHYCKEDVACVGIMIADACNHIVHNREVEDGLCPTCLALRNARNEDNNKGG